MRSFARSLGSIVAVLALYGASNGLAAPLEAEEDKAACEAACLRNPYCTSYSVTEAGLCITRTGPSYIFKTELAEDGLTPLAVHPRPANGSPEAAAAAADATPAVSREEDSAPETSSEEDSETTRRRRLSTTRVPTKKPTKRPTPTPTKKPTKLPTGRPTKRPVQEKAVKSTRAPTKKPTKLPTAFPTRKPTRVPTQRPTKIQKVAITAKPSAAPSAAPSTTPTTSAPTTKTPTMKPTTRAPTKKPTVPPPTTRAPTTRAPTRDPTTPYPTTRPSAAPTRSTDFQSPTRIKPHVPWDASLFAYERPDPKLCMIMVVPRSAFSVTYSNWKGTQAQCFRECEYDNGCKYATYSATLRECIKSTRIEMWDSALDIVRYIAEKWTSVRKVGAVPLYWNNFCDNFNAGQGHCLQAKVECGWNKGLRGFNQVHVTQADGWCGRIKCLASPVK